MQRELALAMQWPQASQSEHYALSSPASLTHNSCSKLRLASQSLIVCPCRCMAPPGGGKRAVFVIAAGQPSLAFDYSYLAPTITAVTGCTDNIPAGVRSASCQCDGVAQGPRQRAHTTVRLIALRSMEPTSCVASPATLPHFSAPCTREPAHRVSRCSWARRRAPV